VLSHVLFLFVFLLVTALFWFALWCEGLWCNCCGVGVVAVAIAVISHLYELVRAAVVQVYFGGADTVVGTAVVQVKHSN
jgi:hypothetical protein